MRSRSDVLVVEDDSVVVESARRVLAPIGLGVDHAGDVQEALQRLESHAYRVILADLMLPRTSGFELLGTVRDHNPDTPIVLITGYATLANAVRSLNLGAFDFLPKPFDADELSGVVQRALYFADPRRDPLLSPTAARGERHCLGRHSWVRLDAEGTGEIGAGATVYGSLGDLQAVRLPTLGEQLAQGSACAELRPLGASACRVWAALGGTVVEVNRRLEREPNLVRSDPYQAGWLTRIVPSEPEADLAHLMNGPVGDNRDMTDRQGGLPWS